MYEILQSLPSTVRVLDLGCASGSFKAASTAARVIRVDREINVSGHHELIVQSDAAHLPFADHTFAAVISNHSLEHFDDLPGTLREIARVIDPRGALFVAVPDASTFCDQLYRWLASGGGHVNAFTSSADLARMIEAATGLRHAGTRTLYTSLSFLNRRNSPSPRPRRLALLGGGHEWSLFLFAWLSRWLDRRFGRRTSVYGWALYFGSAPRDLDLSAYINVCLRCGSGSPAAMLKENNLVRGWFLGPSRYRCPQCGATNPFAGDSQL